MNPYQLLHQSILNTSPQTSNQKHTTIASTSNSVELIQNSSLQTSVHTRPSGSAIQSPTPCSSKYSDSFRKRNASPSHMLQSLTCTPRKKKLYRRIRPIYNTEFQTKINRLRELNQNIDI